MPKCHDFDISTFDSIVEVVVDALQMDFPHSIEPGACNSLAHVRLSLNSSQRTVDGIGHRARRTWAILIPPGNNPPDLK
jgi:hypothetical protein